MSAGAAAVAAAEGVAFRLDGREVVGVPGETIWQVAVREGIAIPHLCHSGEPGYRPDGNCRACMVEVEGERTLAASCIRRPAAGMRLPPLRWAPIVPTPSTRRPR